MKPSPEHPASAAGEPAVIRRFPKGIECRHIKAIFMEDIGGL